MRKIVLTMPPLCLQSNPSKETVTFPHAGDLKQKCTKQLKMTVGNNFKVISYNMTLNLCSMFCKHSQVLHNIYICAVWNDEVSFNFQMYSVTLTVIAIEAE